MIFRHLLLFCTFIWLSLAHEPTCTLSILSLLPYPDQNPAFNPSYTNGPDIVPTGYLALEMINNRSDILSDYRLELVEGRGGCGTETITLSEKSLYQHIFLEGKRVVGIVGPRCSDSAERVGQIIAKNAIALANVHITSSPTLGTPSIYPYSTSTTPSIMRYVDAYVALIIRNNWENASVAFLFEDTDDSYSILNDLTGKLNGSGVVYSSIVTDNYILTALLGLEASSARLVLVNLDGDLAQKFICIALRRNAIYPKYQWTFLQITPYRFTDIDFLYSGVHYSCNCNDFGLALNNSVAFNFSYTPRSSVIANRGISGLTYAEYMTEYSKAVQRYNAGIYGTPAKIAKVSKLGSPFYDSIWVLALALNATDAKLKRMNRSLCEYGYGQPDVTNMIQEEVLSVNFLGAGGYVRYTYDGTTRFPPGIVNLWMYQDVGQCAGFKKLGCFDDLGALSITLSKASFIQIINQERQIPLPFSIVFQLASIVALLLTASIHVLNVAFRAQSVIKASSHRLNHVAYVGCYLLIATVVTLSITEAYVFSLSVKDILCNLMPWTASIGFTLVYGTVMVKLYRLYNLLIIAARRFQLPSNDRKILSDTNLFIAIIALTIPNVIICMVWITMDPIRVTPTSKLELSAMQPITMTFESCLISSTKMPMLWGGLLIGYMGLLGSMVAIAAFLTRSISIQNYKTDNIVVLSFLLFLLCNVGLPMYIIKRAVYTDPEDERLYLFLMIALLLVIFVYLCVILLFFPPVYPLLMKTSLGWMRHLKSHVVSDRKQ